MGGTILIAEDNPVNRLVTTSMLENLEYSTDTLDNWRQAIDAIARGGNGLVLMDSICPN
jgi:CheY-like chemotaxis protein